MPKVERESAAPPKPRHEKKPTLLIIVRQGWKFKIVRVHYDARLLTDDGDAVLLIPQSKFGGR
jgi:hypothetical protein